MWLWLIPVYCHLISWASSLWLLYLCPSFSPYLVWLSCLSIFCLAIGQGSLYYQQMGSTHIHSIQKNHLTAKKKKKCSIIKRIFSIFIYTYTNLQALKEAIKQDVLFNAFSTCVHPDSVELNTIRKQSN